MTASWTSACFRRERSATHFASWGGCCAAISRPIRACSTLRAASSGSRRHRRSRWQADGELMGTTPFHVVVEPLAVRLLVPRDGARRVTPSADRTAPRRVVVDPGAGAAPSRARPALSAARGARRRRARAHARRAHAHPRRRRSAASATAASTRSTRYTMPATRRSSRGSAIQYS